MADADVQIDVELNFNTITGSNPVLTTEGVNPETLKEKVDDGSERRATWSYGRVA